MKKLSIILFFIVLGMSSICAQEHMKFMGKSMDCTMKQMQTHLEDRGFKYHAELHDGVYLKGPFQGYDDCIVGIYTRYGIISNCLVALPKTSNWSQIYTDYQKIVAKLTTKYGEPEIEEWFEDSDDLSEYGKMRQVRARQCHYEAYFFVDYGGIIVSIEPSESIFISYFDDKNGELIKEKEFEEL